MINSIIIAWVCLFYLSGTLYPVDPSTLHVTFGHIQKQGPTSFRIIDSMRVELPTKVSDKVEISFTYLGASQRTDLLANGELRRQIGIKLRAKDTCNVVYAMWYIEPTQGLHISIKHNEGKNTHAQCGAGGYIGIQPEYYHAPPTIHIGQKHTLLAYIDKNKLSVIVDGVLSWVGTLPPVAFDFDRASGIRADNGEFDVEMRVER